MLVRFAKKREGFVILYAVIITTVVLVVGVSLMNIITKQLVLSSIGRNAKVAYYAALSGRECAQFWIRAQQSGPNPGNYFGKDDPESMDDPAPWLDPSVTSEIKCNGSDPLTTKIVPPPPVVNHKAVVSFSFDITVDGQKSCAIVNVKFDGNNCPQNRLLVVSNGYNAPCADVDTPSSSSNLGPRVVESLYKDKIDLTSSGCYGD